MDPDVREAFAKRDRERTELLKELRARDEELRTQGRVNEDFAAGSTRDRRRLHHRLERVIRQLFILVIVLFVAQLIIGGGVLVVNANQGETAGQTAETAKRAESLAKQIQASRLEQIAMACEAQNRRNGATLTLLKNLPAREPRPGVPRRGTPAYNRLLQRFTNALAGPVRDCDRVVKRLANAAKG